MGSLVVDNAVLVITAGIAVAAGFVLRSWAWPKPIPGIPHNEITSIWGDLKELMKAKRERGAAIPYFFEPLADRLGPIFQVFMGPLGTVVVISDAQEMEDLLLRRTKSLETSKFSMQLIGGIFKFSQVSLRTSDERYRRHRRSLGPSMSPKYLRLMTPRIISNINNIIRLWKVKTQIAQQSGGSCFSCDQDLHVYTMDTMGEICLGQNFDGIDKDHISLYDRPPQIDEYGGVTFLHLEGPSLHKAAEHVLKVFESASSIPPPLMPLYYYVIKLGHSWRSNYGTLSSAIRNRISYARAQVEYAKAQGDIVDMADCILDMIVDREDSDAMSDAEILDELIGLLVFGQDNISAALAFGIKYLSNNPDVQLKLHKELAAKLDVPQGHQLTYDEVASSDELPYLEAVVSEILRLGSISASINKEATENMTILGYEIPKGTKILFLSGYVGKSTTEGVAEADARAFDPVRSTSSLAHGLSKGRWPVNDAQVFKPERWLVEEHDLDGTWRVKFSAKQGVSFPFGLGPRQCFGMKLVILQMKLFIASLNQVFFLDKVPESLDSPEVRAAIARHPKQVYVAPREW